MYPVTLRLILFKNVLPKRSMEISMYPLIMRVIQKFFTKRVHGNFHVPSNIETNSKMFLPMYKWSMEISMYTVTLILRLYQKFFRKRFHRNFHVSCNIETNIIQKCFTEKVHGNFHVSLNNESNSEILYQRVHGNFHVPSNIETNSKLFLLKGSMEISMYPATSSLIKKIYITKRMHGNLVVTVTVMHFF